MKDKDMETKPCSNCKGTGIVKLNEHTSKICPACNGKKFRFVTGW